MKVKSLFFWSGTVALIVGTSLLIPSITRPSVADNFGLQRQKIISIAQTPDQSDYDTVQQLLKAGKVEDAGLKTRQMLINAVDRENEGKLNAEDWQKVDCGIIQKIDKTWSVSETRDDIRLSFRKDYWRELGWGAMLPLRNGQLIALEGIAPGYPERREECNLRTLGRGEGFCEQYGVGGQPYHICCKDLLEKYPITARQAGCLNGEKGGS